MIFKCPNCAFEEWVMPWENEVKCPQCEHLFDLIWGDEDEETSDEDLIS